MPDRKVAYGLAFVLLIVGICAGTVAVYRGVLRSWEPVTVDSDRAGLTLAAGAPVKMRGVEIGRVGKVSSDGSGARILLEIKDDMMERVPADATAQIVPPTAFGSKYVQLSPAKTGSQRIQAGAVIPATKTTVEIDEAFTNLTKVLDAARPAQVNAALSAAADAVNERGEVIGQLVTQTDRYLTSINPYLDTLSEDISSADDVLGVYDRARPDLVGLASDAGRTSQTLVNQQASLRALEVSLTSFGQDTRKLLKSSGGRLTTAVNLLEPTTDVLEKYSPELPCTVLGLASTNKLAEAAVGGTHPGVTTISKIVPNRDPYTYAQNLPEIGDTRGPACYGLPYVDPSEATQQPTAFHTGANPYNGPQPTPNQAAATTLLGLLAGGANLP